MSRRGLRLLSNLSGLCGLVVFIWFGFSAFVEGLSNFGILHSQHMWAVAHPGDWLPYAAMAVISVASIISWLAKRALRSRTTSPERRA